MTRGRLEGDCPLASPVGEHEELGGPRPLAGEHARMAAALPRNDRSAAVAERPVLDAAARGQARTRRTVERVAREDRVCDGAATLPVEDGGRATTGRIVLAGADRLPAELRRVVREGYVVDPRVQELRDVGHT